MRRLFKVFNFDKKFLVINENRLKSKIKSLEQLINVITDFRKKTKLESCICSSNLLDYVLKIIKHSFINRNVQFGRELKAEFFDKKYVSKWRESRLR